MNKKYILNAIVIIGEICSGKSSVAKEISRQLGYTIISFGAYVNYLCEIKNIPPTRENKQNLGAQLVAENPIRFLKNATSYSTGDVDSPSVIFEGVRHLSILNSIREIAQEVMIIFLDYDFETRYSRYLSREKLEDSFQTRSYFEEKCSHLVESEIREMQSFSNLTVSSEDFDENIKAITQFLTTSY